MAIRRAGEGDCGPVYDLVCQLEGEALPRPGFAEIFRAQLGDSRYCCLLCERDGRAAGLLNLRFEPQLHHAASAAEILEFVVDEDLRGSGIGGELLADACAEARERGCVLIEAACNCSRTDAHRFYQNSGMRRTHFRFEKLLPAPRRPENGAEQP